ncbi:hypothetical protein BDN70DRAFT_90513 [Pholiota conissans]|uniref:Uncharacterized protein n=1 Tax=Pholiota conissans TaxID=109636 RepID=A0A9P5Z1L2_9AGAR|nr:hypothetical protein BDN70DRAFT_90513 [Pholiota conissans]
MSSQTFLASDEEVELARQLLKVAECEQAGALHADVAVDIFGRSRLTVEQLRDIWNLADKNGSGDLSIEELAMAIRLMGWAQAGESLHENLLHKTGPLPTLDGIASVKKLNHIHFPPVSSVEIHAYKQAFVLAGPVQGILEGQKAMDAFMISNLSYDELRRIGGLVDNDGRGALDCRQFCMAMYLIHAFQSCLIPAIPTSIPQEVCDQFADIQPPAPDSLSPPFPRSRSSSSLSRSTTSPRITPLSSGDSTPLSPIPDIAEPHEHERWDILPHEKTEADQHFSELDPENKGYIETAAAAKFLMSYDLPQAELGRIWLLADLNRDNRLTPDEFAIVMHLLRQRLAGEPVPETLPPELLSPTLKTKFRVSGIPPPFSPPLKAKPPPPPIPRKDIHPAPPVPSKDQSSISIPNGRHSRARTISAVVSPASSNPRYSMPLSPPLSPSASMHRLKPKSSLSATSPMSFLTSPARPRAASSELLSPFEDPEGELHSNTPSRIPSPSPSPQPPSSDTSGLEALEQSFKKETGRLTLLVESLRAQLLEQGQLREVNTKLQKQNDTLKSELRDMERTVSEVLSANDRLGSQEQYIREIDRLTAEVESKETESGSLKRVLDVVKEEEERLRTALRESEAVATKSSNEVTELRSTITTQTSEIQQLKSRLADMSNAMAEPSSATNNRELRVLLRDATKENEGLKTELRDTQKSMERLLLSSKFPTQMDELQRENRRLKEQVQDLRMLAMTVQSSSAAAANTPSSRAAEVARENEQLKQQLKDGQRAMADLRERNETKLVEMQQQIDSLTHENRRLKLDMNARGRPPHEDNSVPPPAYDDSFVIPP